MNIRRFVLAGLAIFALVSAVYLGWLSGEWKGRVDDAISASLSKSRILEESVILKKVLPNEIRIVFVGDIMLARGVAYQVQKNGGDYTFPFLLAKDFLAGADLTFGNLEGPISERGKNQGSIYSFRFSPEVTKGLVFAGFDVLSVANNHIWDWGAEALSDTVEILNRAGIKVVGAGRNYKEANEPAIFEIHGTKIAFLAYTNLYPRSLAAGENSPGLSDFDIEDVKNSVGEAEKLADVVIVSYHWGEEYQAYSNLNQQELAHKLVEVGADLVVGHHPHIPQEIEQYRGAHIAYSLGNFVFDQNFSEETMKGLALEVRIRDGKILEVSPKPFKINSRFQPYFEAGVSDRR